MNKLLLFLISLCIFTLFSCNESESENFDININNVKVYGSGEGSSGGNDHSPPSFEDRMPNVLPYDYIEWPFFHEIIIRDARPEMYWEAYVEEGENLATVAPRGGGNYAAHYIPINIERNESTEDQRVTIAITYSIPCDIEEHGHSNLGYSGTYRTTTIIKGRPE